MQKIVSAIVNVRTKTWTKTEVQKVRSNKCKTKRRNLGHQAVKRSLIVLQCKCHHGCGCFFTAAG
jgi:hypothetical protein